MGTGRDDFSEETKRRAGLRVGYRCSFPKCRIATVGPSFESDNKTASIGVAAHICAASEGGPRYDANMSHEERKSISNCIWMCQTHAHLIDTDVDTYTVDKLREWKLVAEQQAAAELADSKYFSEYYKHNQNNLAVIEHLFESMIAEGQYDQLILMLEQYETGLLSDNYDEFVLRHRVFYDVYCCRADLQRDLELYCDLPCKIGIEKIAKLFIEFLLSDELSIIQKYCTDEELQKWVTACIDGKLDNMLFRSAPEQETISVPDGLKTTVMKAASNLLRAKGLVNVKMANGDNYEPYSEEFYYRTSKTVYSLVSGFERGDPVENLINGKEYEFIKNNIKKILLLDPILQEYIWVNILSVLADTKNEFLSLFKSCPSELKELKIIRSIEFQNKIFTDIEGVDVDDLCQFCEQTNEYRLLYQYLKSIQVDDAIKYLRNHAYLLAKSSLFLLLITESGTNSQTENSQLLQEYSDTYDGDVLYNCLLLESLNDERVISKKIDWLKSKQTKMDVLTLRCYLKELYKHKQWDTIVDISRYHLPIFLIEKCIEYLSYSNKNGHLERGKELAESLVENGAKNRWFQFFLGNINRKLGFIEAAKLNYKNEYDAYKSKDALANLISLRFETNEFIEDSYFIDCKGIAEWTVQNIVGATFFKMKNYPEARKHFLRSLLLSDKDNPSANGLFQVFINHADREEPEQVEANTVCLLKNNDEQLRLALHSPEIMERISPNSFADCTHISVENPSVAQLQFCSAGDHVQYNGREYIIKSVTAIDDWLSKYVFSAVIDSPDTITIRGEGADDLVEKVAEVLKSSSDNIESAISSYNSLRLRSPLTAFSKTIGKPMLSTCEFLCYGNKSRIRNNFRFPENENPVFVMAYDGIVMLCHMGFDFSLLEDCTLLCSVQVKNQILNDINEELGDLRSKNVKGRMFFDNGSLRMVEQTSEWKRERYAFLAKMKSFVNSIDSSFLPCDYTPTSERMRQICTETSINQGLLCEMGTLGLAQNTKNAVIVSDDEFVFNIANTENIANTGLLGLLTTKLNDWRSLLKLSKQLYAINFLNYLPMSLYRKMVDLLIENETDTSEGSEEIFRWIASDTTSEPSECHEDVIFNLFQEVYHSGEGYLDPNALIARMAINITEKRNPGFIQDSIERMFQSQGDHIAIEE